LIVRERENLWNSNLRKEIKDCCPYKKKGIYIPFKILEKIKALSRLDTEVVLFLRVEEKEDYIKISEIKIPKQKSSSASCKALEDFPECEGVLHTHPMNAFFSSTDEEHLNANNKVSLVLGKDGNIRAFIRERMPCGELLGYEAKILAQKLHDNEIEKFLEEVKEKIEKEEVIIPALEKFFCRRMKEEDWNGLYL